MSLKVIHASRQIKDTTITRELLVTDFLNGTNLNLTNGANNATLTGLAAGSAPNDAVNKSQLDSVLAALNGRMLESVDAVAVANIALTGTGQTVNGRVIVDGDRVFAAGQTTTTQDGIYVAAAGAWSRSTDAATGTDIGATSFVYENAGAPQLWVVTNVEGSGVIGTDNLNIAKGYESTVLSTEVYNEAVSVTNGNANVTVANTPSPTNSLRIFLNGVFYSEGNGFSRAGATLTFDSTLATGDVVKAHYKY